MSLNNAPNRDRIDSEIAETWGLEQLSAETTRDNFRMIAALRGSGFDLEYDAYEDAVLACRRFARSLQPAATRGVPRET